MKQKQIKRSFGLADSIIVVRAGVICKLFKEDKDDFTNYSGVLFHVDYIRLLQDKIHTIYNCFSDKEIHKNLARHTQNVEKCIDELSHLHAGIMVFAIIAFKHDEVTLRQMGKGSMTEIKDNHFSFQVNMNRIKRIFEKEKYVLEQAGCPLERIENFHVLYETLVTAHVDQENYKITRTGLTAERITLLNEIYATLVQLHQVANIIWAHDREYAMRYDLPKAALQRNDQYIFDEEEMESEIEDTTHEDFIDEE